MYPIPTPTLSVEPALQISSSKEDDAILLQILPSLFEKLLSQEKRKIFVPSDIWKIIIRFLTVKDIRMFSFVCKNIYTTIISAYWNRQVNIEKLNNIDPMAYYLIKKNSNITTFQEVILKNLLHREYENQNSFYSQKKKYEEDIILYLLPESGNRDRATEIRVVLKAIGFTLLTLALLFAFITAYATLPHLFFAITLTVGLIATFALIFRNTLAVSCRVAIMTLAENQLKQVEPNDIKLRNEFFKGNYIFVLILSLLSLFKPKNNNDFQFFAAKNTGNTKDSENPEDPDNLDKKQLKQNSPQILFSYTGFIRH